MSAIRPREFAAFLTLLMIFGMGAVSSVRAILIADGFTYAGTNGFAASHALATDFVNYPVFGAVGELSLTFGPDNYGVASGTALNNQWVLTAGHVWVAPPINLEFILGGVVYQADMTSLVQHPLWTGLPTPPLSGVSQGWDLALFRLTTPITNAAAFPKLYTKSNEMGQVAISLGAGDIGTGTTRVQGQQGPPLVYAAVNVIDRITQQNYVTNGTNYGGGFLTTDFDSGTNGLQNTWGSAYESSGDPWLWETSGDDIATTLNPAGTIAGTNSDFVQQMLGTNRVEGGTAGGDSGGPTFIQDEGEWKLAGVTSWGVNPWDFITNGGSGSEGLYGDVSYLTRVSEQTDWIESVIPEPGTGALLMMGLGLVLVLFSEARRRVSKRGES